MDKAGVDDYLNFVEYLNQNLPKIQEYYDKVTILRCETSKLLLEVSTIFDPEILMDLNSMEECGLKCDQFIVDGQRIKSEIENEATQAAEATSADKYRRVLEDIGLIKSRNPVKRDLNGSLHPTFGPTDTQ